MAGRNTPKLSIINIFINIKDIESTKQKEELSENIKEPLEIKNTRAEVKTSIKKLKYKVEGISKEVERKKKIESIIK